MRIEAPFYPVVIRSDERGSGLFGSSRGHSPDGSKKYHDGVDLVVEPGQIVCAPFSGMVEKEEIPYATDRRWRGLQIRCDLLRCEIWYMEPKDGLVGTFVERGQLIGFAQDISQKYPPTEEEPGIMTPHVHIRLSLMNYTAIIDRNHFGGTVFVDPMLFFTETPRG